jgi:hypothetical protein
MDRTIAVAENHSAGSRFSKGRNEPRLPEAVLPDRGRTRCTRAAVAADLERR